MALLATTDPPAAGALVEVRGQRWVVSDAEAGEHSTLVALQSVEDGRYGETLEVIWEIEPGRRVLPLGLCQRWLRADSTRRNGYARFRENRYSEPDNLVRLTRRALSDAKHCSSDPTVC